MNLAKWKYSQALKEKGGPISRVSIREIDFFGEPYFEAYAYLDPVVAPHVGDPKVVYGNAQGSGTSKSRNDAIYRAISEALERWAWSYCLNEFRNKNGFQELRLDISSSTDGFAAYPGIFAQSPREIAFSEALERWAVCSWWEGKLGHRAPSQCQNEIFALEIDQPFCTHSVAIIWKDRSFGRVYGFACGENFSFACQKALVELDRNSRVLSEYISAGGLTNAVENLNEKRLLFFSKIEGISKFEKRIANEVSPPSEQPNLIVDAPVIGPWTKYTHIWRCLFDSRGLDSSRHDENRIDYFCF